MTAAPWTASARHPFARWVGELPPAHDAADLERLLGVVRAIAEAGRAEGAWRVLETPEPHGFREDIDGPFEDAAARHLHATGELRLLDLRRGSVAPPRGRLRTPSRLTYRQPDGTLADADVDDAGALLRALRPDALDAGPDHLAPVAPLGLQGSTVRAGDPRPPRVVVTLPTSLWFPRVLDLVAYPPRWVDEPVVGGQNAARLNRFLAAARDAVEDAGGSWSLAGEGLVDAAYADQLDRNGIVLTGEDPTTPSS